MDLQFDIAFRHLMSLEVAGVNHGVAAILGARAAAGDQSQKHRDSKKQGKKLLHGKVPPKYFPRRTGLCRGGEMMLSF